MTGTVDPETVKDLFRRLQEYEGHLRQLARLPREDLTADPILLGAAKYYLHVAIESCIDVANHVISRLGLRPPESYADSFSVLAENSIIDKDFAATTSRMVRMRNRLVHLYWDVDADVVYDVLQHDLSDFGAFRQQITEFITRDK